MKTNKLILLTLLIIVVMVGCNDANIGNKNIDNNPQVEENEEANKDNESNSTSQDKVEIDQKELIMKKAIEAVYSLRDKDMVTLSKLTHPKKGIRFSPNYLKVENIILNREEIRNYFKIDEVYTWGFGELSTLPIELTPEEYYERYIYNEDYINADKIEYKKSDEYWLYKDTITVEYYVEREYDWYSLNLVFQEYDNEWYLIGIMRNSEGP